MAIFLSFKKYFQYKNGHHITSPQPKLSPSSYNADCDKRIGITQLTQCASVGVKRKFHLKVPKIQVYMFNFDVN